MDINGSRVWTHNLVIGETTAGINKIIGMVKMIPAKSGKWSLLFIIQSGQQNGRKRNSYY